jgi:hypothetical protein
VRTCLGVLANVPAMESQEVPQWSSQNGDCPRCQRPAEGSD